MDTFSNFLFLFGTLISPSAILKISPKLHGVVLVTLSTVCYAA